MSIITDIVAITHTSDIIMELSLFRAPLELF